MKPRCPLRTSSVSRLTYHDLISPRLQLRGRFGCGLVFDWIDLCADLLVGWNSGVVCRGGGEPAVRFSAAGQGAVAAGLRRRSAELLGAQGRRLHRRDQVASPSCFHLSCFSVVVEAVELSACPFGQIGSIASNVVGLSEEYSV